MFRAKKKSNNADKNVVRPTVCSSAGMDAGSRCISKSPENHTNASSSPIKKQEHGMPLDRYSDEWFAKNTTSTTVLPPKEYPEAPFSSFRKHANAIYKALKNSPFEGNLNRLVQDFICQKNQQLPHQYATSHPYTTWEGLTNFEWSDRHLPMLTEDEVNQLPPIEKLMELFKRPNGQETLCPKSTMVFPNFAQFLTDGFAKSIPGTNFLRNNATHELDLCQIYGRTKAQTDCLRLMSSSIGEKGRLKSCMINGEEWPMPYFLQNGKVDPQFESLDPPKFAFDHVIEQLSRIDPDGSLGLVQKIKKSIFAVGSDRSNTTPGVAAIASLFLREHNRLAAEVENRNPAWDDEQIFQTARNINIVIYIRIIVEDYLNHISHAPFDFKLDPGPWSWDAKWNRTWRVAVEFSTIYRWHSLIPNAIQIGEGDPLPIIQSMFNNELLIDRTLLKAFEDFSSQRATSFTPFNTADIMLPREYNTILQARQAGIRYYVDYCNLFGFPVKLPKNYSDITSDEKVQKMLEEMYGKGNVDKVEFYIGLICATHERNAPFSIFAALQVAHDAFKAFYTNPLLQRSCWKEETFSKYGWDLVTDEKLVTVKDLVERNSPNMSNNNSHIGFTRPGWEYSSGLE